MNVPTLLRSENSDRNLNKIKSQRKSYLHSKSESKTWNQFQKTKLLSKNILNDKWASSISNEISE